MPLLGFPLGGLLGDDTETLALGPITKITDHASRAAGALIEQYKDKPKMVGLLTAFVNQVQAAEDGFWTLFDRRRLPIAVGVILDLFGRVVGEPRNGRTDASYRIAVQAKILLNLSSGTIEELYAMFALLLSGSAATMRIQEFYPKAFVLRLLGAAVSDTTAADLAALLRRAKDAGATGQLEYGNTTPFFGLDGNGAGLDAGYLGGTL